MTEKTVTERAYCHDCRWIDTRPGARGRGSQHATRTGHEVETRKTTTYHRAANPDQLAIPEAAAA